jgi:hypothetical protein
MKLTHFPPLTSLFSTVLLKHVQAADEDIKLLLAGRNELESYLLEIRAAPRRKHGKHPMSVCLELMYDVLFLMHIT